MKAKGFSARVPDKSDKTAICEYLNSEIDHFMVSTREKVSKISAWYKAEKTRIRRTVR